MTHYDPLEARVCPLCLVNGASHQKFCPEANRGTVEASVVDRRREAALIPAEVRWLAGGQMLEILINGRRVIKQLSPAEERVVREATR